MNQQIIFGVLVGFCLLGASAGRQTSTASSIDEDETETPSSEGKICNPGEMTDILCNKCICNQDGMGHTCTNEACNLSTESSGAPGILSGEEVKPKDIPSTRDGMAESKPWWLVPEKEDDKCKPGEMFKKDCNDCECPASGKKSEAQVCGTMVC